MVNDSNDQIISKKHVDNCKAENIETSESLDIHKEVLLQDFPSFLSSSAFSAIDPTSPNSSIPSDTFTPIKSRSPPPSTSRNYQSLSSPLSNDLVFVLPNDYSPANNSDFNVACNNFSLEYSEPVIWSDDETSAIDDPSDNNNDYSAVLCKGLFADLKENKNNSDYLFGILFKYFGMKLAYSYIYHFRYVKGGLKSISLTGYDQKQQKSGDAHPCHYLPEN